MPAVATLSVSLAAGAMFGIALAAPPGPVNAVIAEESILRGWRAGTWAGVGAMFVDGLLCLLTFVGVIRLIEEVPQLQTVMLAGGGLLMLYFAYGAFRGARESFVADPTATERQAFRKTVVLSLTNPYQILFWLTVGVGLLQPGRLDVLAPLSDRLAGQLVVETGSPALLVGLFGGIAVWIVVYPVALAAVGDRVDAAAPVVAALSGVVLAGFGVWFLLDALLAVA